jgi:predicted kinase
MAECIVFAGIQGAGKSTLFSKRFSDTHVRLNLDMLKTRNRETVLLHACLSCEQSVVVDNTNPTAAQRQRYLQLASAAGFRTALYWFDTPVAIALERNATRTGRARVPDVAIRGTAAKLEDPNPGAGWDKVYRVLTSGEVVDFIGEEHE